MWRPSTSSVESSRLNREYELIRMFSHWVPSRTALQILFDILLLFAMVMGAAWLDRERAPSLGMIIPYALLFALLTTAVNKLIGFYNFESMRSVSHVVAIALGSFVSPPQSPTPFSRNCREKHSVMIFCSFRRYWRWPWSWLYECVPPKVESAWCVLDG